MAVGVVPVDPGNVLTVANATNLIDAVKEYGTIVAKSGFFGCKTPEQGQALVLMAFSEGVPIGKYQERFHIVGTRLTMKADYMRTEFRRIGGDYKWVNKGESGDVATLWVKYLTNEGEISYSIEDAKREGLIKAGGNWITRPGEMLRARVTTKAVRMVCPEALSGMMTDEEFEAVQDAPHDSSDRATPTATAPSVVSASSSDGPSMNLVEAAAEKTREQNNLASGEAIKEITSLFNQLSIPADVQLKAIQQTGAHDMGSLTAVGASALIDKLKQKLAAASAVVHSSATQTTGEASQEQVAELQSAMKLFAQQPGNVNKPAQVKEHMQKHGIEKFVGLSSAEANCLLEAMKANDLSPFLSLALGNSKSAEADKKN